MLELALETPNKSPKIHLDFINHKYMGGGSIVSLSPSYFGNSGAGPTQGDGCMVMAHDESALFRFL